MMKKAILLIFIVSIIFLAGCESCLCPDCICPAAEDCEICEVCSDAETVTVIKYVCPDSTIVDSADACIVEPTTVTEVSDINVLGIETANATTSWETIIEPACILGKNGGRIHYETINLPTTVTVEAKEYGGTYSDVFSFTGLYDAEKAFLVCEGGSCYGGDFVLNAGKVHILKLRYKMTDEVLYSEEIIVDLRDGSDYMEKHCSG